MEVLLSFAICFVLLDGSCHGFAPTRIIRQQQQQQQQQQQRPTTTTTTHFATPAAAASSPEEESKPDGRPPMLFRDNKVVASFMNWARENKIQFSGIQVGPTKLGGGLGLIASEEQLEGDVVASVPTSMAFSVQTPGGKAPDLPNLPQLQRRVVDNLPWFAQMGLSLLDQKQQSNKKVWMDCLPKSFDTPIHWTTKERNELQYNFLEHAVEKQERQWKEYYSTLSPSTTTDSTTSSSNSISWQDFVWGCECARSRAFSSSFTGSAFDPRPFTLALVFVVIYVSFDFGTLEQASNGAALVACATVWKDFVLPKLLNKNGRRYVLCPFVDMANHWSTRAKADVSFEYFGNCYSLAMQEKVNEGEEVFISYGPRSNDQLLQYYGFVERDNPHDVYVMPSLRQWNIEALEKACGKNFPTSRLQKLERAGLLGFSSATVVASMDDEEEQEQQNDDDETSGINRRGGVVVTRATGLDPAVVQALRALVSSDEEWKRAGEAVGSFSQPVSMENERLARIAAYTGMQLELDSKPTTLEQDVNELKAVTQGGGATAGELLAVTFRVEKKKLLQETMQSLRQ